MKLYAEIVQHLNLHLKKKHHSIAYHRNHEAVAAGTFRITKEATETNLSNLFTKILSKVQREALLDRFTY